MDCVATLTFTDVDSGEEAIAVVRADTKIVGLTLSLKTGADLEVLMPVDVARRLTDASHAVLAIGCDRR
jgi:hypothetical protein